MTKKNKEEKAPAAPIKKTESVKTLEPEVIKPTLAPAADFIRFKIYKDDVNAMKKMLSIS